MYNAANISRKQIQSIVTSFQSVPTQVDEDVDIELNVFCPATRERVVSAVINPGPLAADIAQTRDRQDEISYINRIPEQVKIYPGNHTTTGAITFPLSGRKFSGAGLFNGSSFITIDDAARFKPTDKISFGGWFYIPDNPGVSGYSLMGKDLSYGMAITDTSIQSAVYIGGVPKGVIFPFSTWDTWVHIWNVFDGSTLETYVNKFGVDTAAVGAMDTNTNDLLIGSGFAGTVDNGVMMSHVSVIHEAVSLAWVTDHYNGILDTDGTNEEITTIPFVAHERPITNCSVGHCQIN